jgi:hypothetical protein
MTLHDYLEPLKGRDRGFLLEHFCAGVAGRKVSLESIFTPGELDWMFDQISRKREAATHYGAQERMTWRRDHLTSEEVAGIRRPRVDELTAKRLLKVPASTCSTIARWPDGRRFAICVTHDMDHISSYNGIEPWRRLRRMWTARSGPHLRYALEIGRALRSSAGAIVRRHVLRSPDRTAGVSEWMKLEDSFGFKSTFFFFPSRSGAWHASDCTYTFFDKAPLDGHLMPVRQVMRHVAGAGWEVGLHPSYYSATSSKWLQSQKRACEEAIQKEVVSVRQHTLQYDPVLTPVLQAQAGLCVDSTQGFNDLIGFRAGTLFPYLNWDWQGNTTMPLLEIPLHIQDGPLLRGSTSIDEAIADCVGMLEDAERVGGCLVILFHPYHLATDAGSAVFKAVLEESKARNAWGCSVQQLAHWWLKRTHQILCSQEDSGKGCTADSQSCEEPRR